MDGWDVQALLIHAVYLSTAPPRIRNCVRGR